MNIQLASVWRWLALQWFVTDRLVGRYGRLPSIFSISLMTQLVMQCGRPEFEPWVGEIPWKGERLPTSVFWPGEFHGLYIHGVAESDPTEWFSLFITSVLSFLIAELLLRNFCFLQSGVAISLSLFCQSYWYCQQFQFLTIALDFFAFHFHLPPSWFRTLHFFLDYCNSLVIQLQVCSCFYPVLFLPFSTQSVLALDIAMLIGLRALLRPCPFVLPCLKQPPSGSAEILTFL